MRVPVFFVAVLCFACVEPYEFTENSKQQSLVVEGYLSNVSYSESVNFPSDGRYFTVSLRYSSDANNTGDEMVAKASVSLISDTGEEWEYSESLREPGKYVLRLPDFEAEGGKAYKLHIELANEETYESDWETLPESATTAPIGIVGFDEVEKSGYVTQAGEKVVRTIKGVNVYIEVPENESAKPVFYRWSFEPSWVYIAPLARSSDPNFKCLLGNESQLS
jgi:hypothetical protein